MNLLALTLVLDVGGIVGFIFWAIVILVILGIVIYVASLVLNSVGEGAGAVDKVIATKLEKSEIEISPAQLGIYSLLTFGGGFGLTLILIEIMPENLWYISIIPFFGSFFVIYYLNTLVKK